jgi:excisionase family DNA binding protein
MGAAKIAAMPTHTAQSPSIAEAPAYFNRGQIAKHLGLSKSTISAMVAGRRIPHLRIGGRVLFDPVAVTAHFAKNNAVAAVA